MSSPQYNYIQIIGDCFPEAQAYVRGNKNIYDYDSIQWITTPIPKATLEASECSQGPVITEIIQGKASKSDGVSSTTAGSYQPKVSLTTLYLPNDIYRIGWYAEVTNTRTNGRTEIMVQVNDTDTLCEPSIETKDNDDWVPFSGFDYIELSGINTIDMYYRRSEHGTAKIRRARLEIGKYYDD